MVSVVGLARLVVVGCVALAGSLAVAETNRERTYGWEIYSRPAPTDRAHPDEHPEKGFDKLPGLPWAKVYVPKSYQVGVPAPMALLLHGSGGDGRTMIRAFQSLADANGVILVAPDSMDYSWDIMVRGVHLKNTTEIPPWGPDVGRIDKALDRAFTNYAIDTDKVALIGFSDGAGYGLSLGTNNADLFQTVIAFAPGLLTRIDGKGRGRVFLAHGDKDQVLPPSVTSDIFAPALAAEGFDVSLHLFKGRHEMPKALRAEAFDWWLKGG